MFRLRVVRKVQLLSTNLIRQRRAFSDVTAATDKIGFDINLPDKASLTLYNESITNFLTHECDPGTQLRTIRKSHKNNGMVNALLVFQMTRQPRPSNTGERNEIEEILRNLEDSQREGKLSAREEYFASAAASFVQGNYLKSAALLESLFIGKNSDIIALKLAQDSYMLAGDSVNALGCIARWMHLFDTNNELNGHVLGMFAAGLIETGRYNDCEEIANKAVTKTGGEDVWALTALLNAYMMNGKSSEMAMAVEDHLQKHKKSTIGLNMILFSKGCGLMMRGNSTGCLRAHDDMIMNMCEVDDLQVAGSLANATLLLWLADINSPSDLVEMRWRYLHSTGSMWAAGVPNGPVGDASGLKSLSPLNQICRTMAISAGDRCAAAQLTKGADILYPEEITHIEDQSEAGGIDKKTKGKGRMSEAQLLDHLEDKISVVESTAKVIWNVMGRFSRRDWHIPDKVEEPESEEAIVVRTEAQRLVTEDIARYHSNLLVCLNKTLEINNYNDNSASQSNLHDICPLLLSVRPNVGAVRRIPESPLSTTDKDWATNSAVKPLSEAILAFSRHDYDDSCDRFQDNRHVFSRLGGTAAQRDVLMQTLIEGLLRCGRLTEAETLLCERTAMTPSDAQSWRRLASVYGVNGQRKEADRAHYTAWQYGIGQGGFGGPV